MKGFKKVCLKNETEINYERKNDFLLSYLIPKNNVTALMYSNPAPEGIARTETAVVMSALSTAKSILYISFAENACTLEKKFKTLPYEYMLQNDRIFADYEKKNIYVYGKDGYSISLFERKPSSVIKGDFFLFDFLLNNDFDLVVIDDIVEIMEVKKVSSRELIGSLIEMAEQIHTTILFTADTRYSDHAMLSLPCSVIDVKRKPIVNEAEKKEKNEFLPFPDFEIVFRNERNDFIFDTGLYEYGNWIRLDELCEFLVKYSL